MELSDKTPAYETDWLTGSHHLLCNCRGSPMYCQLQLDFDHAMYQMNCDKHSQSECRNQCEWKQIVGLRNIENKKRIQKQKNKQKKPIYCFRKYSFQLAICNLHFTDHFQCCIMSFDEDMTPIAFTYCIVLCDYLLPVLSLNPKMSAKHLIWTAHQLNIFESLRNWTWHSGI